MDMAAARVRGVSRYALAILLLSALTGFLISASAQKAYAEVITFENGNTANIDGNGVITGTCSTVAHFVPGSNDDVRFFEVYMPDGQVLHGKCIDYGRPVPANDNYGFTATPIGNDQYSVIVDSAWAPYWVHTGGWIERSSGRAQRVGELTWLYRPYGKINLAKHSSLTALNADNACYSLSGAVYGIYKSEQDAQARENLWFTQTTGQQNPEGSDVAWAADYWESAKDIPPGDYWVREESASPGFLLDETIYKVTVVAGQNVRVNTECVYDDPAYDPNRFRVQKLDDASYLSQAQGAASLAGAEVTFSFYADYLTEEQLDGKTPTRTWVIKTDEAGYVDFFQGEATSASDEFFFDANGNRVLPLGTITVQESKAPLGYLLGTPKRYLAQIVQDPAIPTGASIKAINYDGNLINTEYNTPVIPETVKRGNIRLEKDDSQAASGLAQGDATLAGAVYEIINRNNQSVVSPQTGSLVEPDGVVCEIVTNADGYASTSRSDLNGWSIPADWDGKALAVGTYEVRESSASSGYRLNSAWSAIVTIDPDGKDGQILDAGLTTEDVKRGSLVIGKIDRENGQYLPQGKADLAGARFSITNISEHNVVVAGVEYAPGSVVASIDTILEGGQYIARTAPEALPYGTYLVKETVAPKGYMLDEPARAWSKTVVIREDQVELDFTAEGDGQANRPARADISFAKVDERTMTRLAHVAFLITSKTTGESHVLLSDENGVADTSWNAHSSNTNANDAAVMPAGDNPSLGSQWVVNDEALDAQAGIWFNGRTDADAEIDDSCGALPFDDYTIEELPCAANEGKALVSFDITVADRRYDHRTVDLGTIDDRPAPSIHTTLTDINEAHSVPAESQLTVTDVIEFHEFEAGSYTAVGTLYLLDEAGNPAEVLATAENSFTANANSGTTELTFTFDASALQGRDMVCFEEVYGLDGTLVAEHKDPSDTFQQIHVVEIQTTLADTTGNKEVPALGPVTLVDTVHYTGLDTDKYYTVSGTLHERGEDGSDLGVARDAYGREIIASTEFMPEASEGTVELSFTFEPDSSGMITVAFEELYYRDRLYGTHADITDEAQTVYIPGIKTTATDSLTDEHVAHLGEIDITDVVEFHNLTPGVSYRLDAELHQRLSADQSDSENRDGGVVSGATGSVTFVPESAHGTVDVQLLGNAEDLAGKTVVVFEKLYRLDGEGEVEVAHHEDIDDEGQSVSWPSIGTTATDEVTGTHLAACGESTTIIDVVAYENLIVGKEYTISGTLHLQGEDGTDLGELADSEGTPVSGTVTFTPESPSGEESITFTFDSSALAGSTVVAFEELSHKGVTVAVHADISDPSQSVSIPKIGTTLTEKKSGSHETEVRENVVLVDSVAYEGLIPGERYRMEGVLYDKSTGKEFVSGGKSVTASAEFVAEQASGSVDLEFSIPSISQNKVSVVAFERVYVLGANLESKALIARHEDINDAGQTVTFYTPGPGKVFDKTGLFLMQWWWLIGIGGVALFTGAAASHIVRRSRLQESAQNRRQSYMQDLMYDSAQGNVHRGAPSSTQNRAQDSVQVRAQKRM